MFNTTHTFVGLAIARTGLDEWVQYAAVTAVIASNLPDIDILTGLGGTPAYLEFHRGITHAAAATPLLALALAGAIYYFSGKFWKTYAVAVIALALHPCLDYTNTYGLRPFLPFDGTWYYGDILYIIDPYIDLILLLGILLGAMFERRKSTAWVSLILVGAYIGARIELHAMAASHMEKYVAGIPTADKWAVFPKMTTPFTWDGIVETKTQMVRVRVDALNGVQEEITRMDRETGSNIPQLKNSETADTLLRFSRFPVTRVEGIRFGAIGYRVLLFDFRFYDQTDNTALGSEIILDQSFHVVKESLSFVQSID